MLKKLSEIQSILNEHKNQIVAFDKITPIISKLFNANRVVTFKTSFDEEVNESFLEFFHEYHDEKTPARYDGDRATRKVYFTKGSIFQKYSDTLAQGKPLVLNSAVFEFMKKNLSDFYKDRDFKSAMILPVKGQGMDLWGAITFHSMDDEKAFDDISEYEDALKLLLSMIESYFLVKNLETEQAQVHLDDHSLRMATLGKIAAGIAHEINNPMFIIGGFATRIDQLIEEKRFENHLEDIRSYLGMIGKNCKRVTDIIAGLRLMSRDTSKDEFEVTDAFDVLQRAIDISKERLQLDKISIELSKSEGDFLVECKPGQLMQVISNLINNSRDSLKSTKAGDWIKLSVERKDSNILIRVTDAGEKIPEDIAAHIMDPFFTTKDSSKGTGLGLSISKEIIKRFDGQLYLDKDCDNVSFVIELPEISFDEE